MKKYVDIERLKVKYEDCFQIGEEITVSEKVDGSNASFTYDPETDTVLAFSRRNPLNETNTLNGFWEWTQRLNKQAVNIATQGGRFIIFGEWLTKHTIRYPDSRLKNFYMFDLWDTVNEQYMPFEDVNATFAGLSKAIEKDEEVIYLAPIFYTGPFKGWDHLYGLMGQTQLNAEPCGEGIVIKTQDRLSDKSTRIPKYIKLVSEKFSEVHKDHKKSIDPEELKKKEALRNYAATIVTKRRAEKILQKMIEDGIIPEDWDEHDMGTIAKNINKLMYEDCKKEEPETVMAIEGFGKICGGLTMGYVRDILKDNTEVKV